MQLPSTTPLFLKPKEQKPVKRELTKEETEEVRFAFDTLDAEHSGSVTQKQLKVALRALVSAGTQPRSRAGQLCSCRAPTPTTPVRTLAAQRVQARVPGGYACAHCPGDTTRRAPAYAASTQQRHQLASARWHRRQAQW